MKRNKNINRLTGLRKEILSLATSDPKAPLTPSAVANSLSSPERPFTDAFRKRCQKHLWSLYTRGYIKRMIVGNRFQESVYCANPTTESYYDIPEPVKPVQLTLPPLASSPTEIYRVEGRLKMLYSSAGKNMVVFEWDKVERIKEA